MSKSIRVAIVSVLVSLFVGSIPAQTPKDTAPKRMTVATVLCGRYQLFQGVWGMPGVAERNVLLRIDTETGKTWVYFEGGSGENARTGWIDVDEWQKSAQKP